MPVSDPAARRPRRSAALLRGLAPVLLAGVCASAAAQGGVMDFLFGKRAASEAVPTPTQRRTWELGEFTALRIVPAEPGATNEHPRLVPAESLRLALGSVRVVHKGRNEPLFGADELQSLTEPISQALINAQPNEDLLLLSTSRRGDGFLVTPTAITARLFLSGGQLQVVVHQARHEFVDQYRGSRIPPQFTFGSRAAAGEAVLQATVGQRPRSDWVALPLSIVAPVGTAPAPAAGPPAPPVAAPMPATTPTGAGGGSAVAAPTPAAPATPSVAPAPVAPRAAEPARAAVRDEAFFREQELRLQNLKRLRERGLITEEEYQAKRREILGQL